MADWPQTAGREIAARPRCMLLDNRSTSRADGRVKWRAVAGFPVLWRTCRNTGWERDGGTRLPTGLRVRETTGPPSDAAERSADM